MKLVARNVKRIIPMLLLVGSLALSPVVIPAAHADYLGYPPTISVSNPWTTSRILYITGSNFTPGGTVDVWLVVSGGASVGYTQTVATTRSGSGRYWFLGGTISTSVTSSVCDQDEWAIAYDESSHTWSNEPSAGASCIPR
jgi:hypothetical protein